MSADAAGEPADPVRDAIREGYYRETPPDRPVLLFSGTVHVMHRGSIPLRDTRVVEV